MPIIRTALENMGICAVKRIFDQGRFLDSGSSNLSSRSVIILCGMRMQTRKSMLECVDAIFANVPCFDFFALYYYWITKYIRRDCDHEELAVTLLAAREEHAISNIDSVNTSYCNLNCKECSNGIPYRVDKKFITPTQQVEDLKRLTDVLPIAYCNIQGGEPFLDPAFPEFLLGHSNNGKIAFLTVATNATIVPSDDVMQVMRSAGAMFRISDYGKLSRRKNELEQKAVAFSVPYYEYPKATTWKVYGRLISHGRNDAENETISKQCSFGTNCLMLYDGVLYCCCRTLFANACKIENNATRENTLNVRQDFSYAQLKQLVTGKNLHLVCDYCDFPMPEVTAAEQV